MFPNPYSVTPALGGIANALRSCYTCAPQRTGAQPMAKRDRMMTFSIRIPNEALAAIDQARTQGLFPRSRGAWIRDAIEHYLVVQQEATTTAHGSRGGVHPS